MVVGCSGPSAQPRFPAAGGTCSGWPPGCGSAQGTSQSLADFAWSAAPAPPLSSRFGQTSLWTGTEFLVWGGVQENRNQSSADDGAAYNPDTRTWSPMPASPLSPRNDAFAAWTGDRALIWGGGGGSDTLLMDGASYDPASRTWTPVPASPLQPGTDVDQAVVWTGTQMVVIQPAAAAAFNPSINTWTSVPALPSVSGWQPYEIQAEWTGSAIVAWVAARPSAVDGSVPSGFSFTGYWWAPGGVAWTRILGELPGEPKGQQDDGFAFGTAAFVAGRLLFLGGNDCPPGASCPAQLASGAAAWFDPSSGTWAYLPNQFSGGAGPAVWTGPAMVVFATKAGAEPTLPDTRSAERAAAIPVGAAAAFDPSTGAWTDLAPCPLPDMTSSSLAWTGQQLIVVAMNGDTGGNPQVEVLSR